MLRRVMQLLRALVDEDFLFRTSDGTFVRVEHAIPLKTTTTNEDNEGDAQTVRYGRCGMKQVSSG